MSKTKIQNLLCFTGILLFSSCATVVSELRPIKDDAQSKHDYEKLQLEYVETRTASQVGSPIVAAELLLEAKNKHGNVTITNLREQRKISKGIKTYYVIYDIVKVK